MGLAKEAEENGLPFFLLQGSPGEEVPRFLAEWSASLAVIDFDPLKEKGDWRKMAMDGCECGFEEVDAHNIVPCWVASPKQEYAAYTFRPKVKLHLPDRLQHLPPSLHSPRAWPGDVPEVDLKTPMRHLGDYEEDLWQGGASEARRTLHDFLLQRLEGYDEKRNDPNLDWQSGLSPYLHFGMISAQEVALAVRASSTSAMDKEAFLEELIIRRELSDNYCHYNTSYDSTEGFPAWSKATLQHHLKDRREYVYGEKELEGAMTHDPLWNAAQLQMVREGKMHGWLRMYWAKKILEWTETPEEALKLVISLNDHYEMDGRDPNGYVGAAWSIGGVHDRAWAERPVFGKVRYMNLNGARRKFDVDRFVSRFNHPGQ